MPFFARPNLEDTQFKQLPDSILSLSGQTRIATTSGLTLSDGAGGNVVVTANGASTPGEVLTFDGSIIKLMPAGAGGDMIYMSPPYKPNASVTLCGIPNNYLLSGKTISCILETMLVPTVNPLLTPNSHTFAITPSGTLYEVGAQVSICGISTYYQGSVSPVYAGGPSTRTGAASAYLYTAFGQTYTCPVQPSVAQPLNSTPYALHLGNNALSGWVSYAGGQYPKNSDGVDMVGMCCPASQTSAIPINIVGIYPYFYGKITSGGAPVGIGRPSLATVTTCITAGCGKTVFDSSGPITINWGSAPDDYVWFATPIESTTKTKWTNLSNPSDTSAIGGPVTSGGNLFPNYESGNPTSTTWSNVAGASPHGYKVYISNYQLGLSYSYSLSNS